jgi:hypothetical protein
MLSHSCARTLSCAQESIQPKIRHPRNVNCHNWIITIHTSRYRVAMSSFKNTICFGGNSNNVIKNMFHKPQNFTCFLSTFLKKTHNMYNISSSTLADTMFVCVCMCACVCARVYLLNSNTLYYIVSLIKTALTNESTVVIQTHCCWIHLAWLSFHHEGKHVSTATSITEPLKTVLTWFQQQGVERMRSRVKTE